MSSNIEFVNTALNGGFLSGFVEASVEKPVDGLNGSEFTTENVEICNGNEEKEITIKEWDGMVMKERLDTVMKEKNNDSMMDYDIETGTDGCAATEDTGTAFTDSMAEPSAFRAEK